MNDLNKNSAFSSKEAQLTKKAYNAFHAAKQRCNNPNHPSYANYGALGVKCLFAHFHEFLDHIGAPPSFSASLDRIDPEGNYEVGNVRWSSAAIQAYNKKGSSLGSNLSIQKQKAILLDKKAEKQRRRDITEAWSMVVLAIHRGGFSKEAIKHLASKGLSPKMFESGWELGQERDHAEPPSYFYLPSLTQLGERVRLSGGPFPQAPWQYDGIIPVMRSTFGSGRDAVKKPFLTDECGALMVGGKGKEWLQLGGLEGIMMFAASYLKTKGLKPILLPLFEVLGDLSELGPKYKWDEEKSRILDRRWLFIPDFQIEYGTAVQPSHQEWNLLASLLDYRLEYGHRTYLGVQNFNGLPHYLREKLLSNLFVRELPEIPLPFELENFEATGPKMTEELGFKNLRDRLAIFQGKGI